MMEECAKRNVVTAFGNPPEYPLVLLVKGGMSHRKPNAKNICMPGDMLVIDFSIRFNGYTSDIARTMYFLKPGEEHAPKEVTDCKTGPSALSGEVMKVIKPGMKGYEVDAVGRQSILDSGYPNIPSFRRPSGGVRSARRRNDPRAKQGQGQLPGRFKKE